MKTISQLTETLLNGNPVSQKPIPYEERTLQSQAGLAKEIGSQQNTPQKLSSSDKQQLTMALSRICALQREYGKTSGELETLVEGFAWALAGYEMPEIMKAMVIWVRSNSQIPTPSDIIKIIDPPRQEWKPDWAYYVALKRKIANEGYFVYGDEREFLRRCERYALDRMRTGQAPESPDEHFTLSFAKKEIHETHLLETPTNSPIDHNWMELKDSLKTLNEDIKPITMPVTDRAYFDARKPKGEEMIPEN